ncbi:MAG: hypothetical protein KME17_08170 [Cyanosarcina radialis HA8281-LM2]|jgi:hypothetical protein|nr:hypothetical protein [Cyanosarcina radialis HA8281-LM2]
MANVTPVQVFPGYQTIASGAPAPADGLFFSLADLPDLSPAEADESSGSFGKLIYAILTKSTSAYNALASTARSSRLTMARGTPSGAGNNLVNVVHTVTAVLDISSADVAAEPTTN